MAAYSGLAGFQTNHLRTVTVPLPYHGSTGRRQYGRLPVTFVGRMPAPYTHAPQLVERLPGVIPDATNTSYGPNATTAL